MNEQTRSNIYDYGSRRGEPKGPEYRTSRTRRRRQKKNRVDAVARVILYFALAVAAAGMVVYAVMRFAPEKEAVPEAAAAIDSAK